MNTNTMIDTNDQLDDMAAPEDDCCFCGVSSPTARSADIIAQKNHAQSASAPECLKRDSLREDGDAHCGLGQTNSSVAAAELTPDNDESLPHDDATGSSQANIQSDATPAAQGCESTTRIENFVILEDSTAANGYDPVRDTVGSNEASAANNAVHCGSSQQDNGGIQIDSNKTASTLTINKSRSIEDEEDFVAIELVSPTNDAGSAFFHEEDAGLLAHDYMQSPPPSVSLENTSAAKTNSNSQNYNHSHQHQNHPKKKNIRHPLLSPLTKLPWEKIISAAGACDILFNCKYSMRQVEDEVREENNFIQYHDAQNIVDEQDNMQCADQEDEIMGLHCCSILDTDEDCNEDGVEGRKENRQRCQQDSHREKEHENEQGPNRLLMEEEKANKSWKDSNPSLDMRLYRHFLDE